MTKNIFNEDFVILDTETTGLYPQQGDALVELAGQRVKGSQVVGEFCYLINPGIPCTSEAAAVHGLTDAYICRNGLSLSKVMPEFVNFCGNATLVGHNIIKFDLEFINNHLRQLGMPPMDNPVVDTLDLARKNLNLTAYHLGNLAAYYKIDYSNAHRAMRDVEITREVFFYLMGIKKSGTLL